MAFTRDTDGLFGGIEQNDGKWDWVLKERFTGATVDSKTGDHEGILFIAGEKGLADYDTAAAGLKAAFTTALG